MPGIQGQVIWLLVSLSTLLAAGIDGEETGDEQQESFTPQGSLEDW